ncbi:hypothetical protein CJF31_00006961 [Rutstroemia sp. NJR-2017a BVV2]|nr:hypothetical protein CJF31_00006961 [Rutstroemia sp. NJR-2017a BVV2]
MLPQTAMTNSLELRKFLRKEVSKSILQLPTRRKRPHNPSVVSRASTDPQKSISRELFSDKEEDFETSVEKFIHTDISPNKLCLSKEKSEIRLRIDGLREQLLEIIAKSHESSNARNEAARERERLIREIEVLEVQERVQRVNALRGMLCMHGIFVPVFGIIGCNLPEPISEGEKKHIQKERCRVQKALEGKQGKKPASKRPRSDNDAIVDLDPDGETRHQLGMSLKRRKIEYTGKWETAVRHQWPELRYKGYGRERLGRLLLAGASEEQKGWLGRWVRSGDREDGKGVGAVR